MHIKIIYSLRTLFEDNLLLNTPAQLHGKSDHWGTTFVFFSRWSSNLASYVTDNAIPRDRMFFLLEMLKRFL